MESPAAPPYSSVRSAPLPGRTPQCDRAQDETAPVYVAVMALKSLDDLEKARQIRSVHGSLYWARRAVALGLFGLAVLVFL